MIGKYLMFAGALQKITSTRIIDNDIIFFFQQCRTINKLDVEYPDMTYRYYSLDCVKQHSKMPIKQTSLNNMITYTRDEVKNTYVRNGQLIKCYGSSYFKHSRIDIERAFEFTSLIYSYNLLKTTLPDIPSEEYIPYFTRQLKDTQNCIEDIKALLILDPNINLKALKCIENEYKDNDNFIPSPENIEIRDDVILSHMSRYKIFINNELPEDFITTSLAYKTKMTSCPVCYKNMTCVQFFQCEHYVCSECFIRFENKICMLCRSDLK
jgi:hypothetical protein